MNNNDIQTALVCAFRYCLGRRSYITRRMSIIIGNNLDLISKKSRQDMIEDIEWAFESNNYGDELDKSAWLDLLHKLIISQNKLL